MQLISMILPWYLRGSVILSIRAGNSHQLSGIFSPMNRHVKQNVTVMSQAAEESKQLFMESVRALASAIDEKDFYTRGHSERVTRFSIEIARIMGMPEDEIKRITIGALIHDIGKLAIDDSILKKPAMLTEEATLKTILGKP